MVQLASLVSPAISFAAPPSNCDRCFAMVRANGTIVKHRNLLANYKIATGQYRLDFKYNINNCAISSSIDSLVVEKNVRLGWISMDRSSNRILNIEIWSGSGSDVFPATFHSASSSPVETFYAFPLAAETSLYAASPRRRPTPLGSFNTCADFRPILV